MSVPIGVALCAAAVGFLVGIVVARFVLSAFRIFVAGYGVVLLTTFLGYALQVPFVLAGVATLAVALYSFVPAAGGFVAGTWLVRAMRVEKGKGTPHAS